MATPTMKRKKGKRWTEENKVYEVDEYRVENPEYGEQVNTIAQMAAKRAETDAAKTLPGVASALRRLFEVSCCNSISIFNHAYYFRK